MLTQMRYLTRFGGDYLQQVAAIANPTVHLIGNGAQFKNVVTGVSGGIATNTTAGTTQDKNGIYPVVFDGSTSYGNLSGVISGTIPGTCTVIMRVKLDNWASGNNEYLWRLRVNEITNEYRAFKTTGNRLTLIHYQGGVIVSITSASSTASLSGVHQVAFTITPSTSNIYLNGNLEATGVLSGIPTGTLTIQSIGGSSGTSVVFPLDGDIYEFVYINGRSLDAGTIKTLYDLTV